MEGPGCGEAGVGASSCPACFSSDPAPCYWPGKALDDGPCTWAPATYVGDKDKAPALTWPSPNCYDCFGVNKRLED